jgi:hypothetical protein
MVSFYEWFLHKHIMHGDPKFLGKFPIIGDYLKWTAESHHEHHKLININMTMKENKPDDRSAYFPWSLSVGLAISFYILSRPIIPKPLIVSILITFIHNLLWNNWHTRFHAYEHDVSVLQGPPKISFFPLGPIYNYLWKYHTIHHSQKGEKYNFNLGPIYNYLWKYHTIHHSQKGEKYNFNIIFPFFDHVFGTLGDESCINNVDFCKKNHHDDRCYQEQVKCFTGEDILR